MTPASRCRADFLAEARERTAAAGWPEEAFARMLRHGGLHLDGRPHADADLPPRVREGVRADAHAFAWEPEAPFLGAERILLDQGGLVAVDKPAFLPVQSTRASRLISLEGAVRALLGEPDLVAVHRLDRETSGVVLMARDRDSLRRAARAFHSGAVRKRYLALVAPSLARAAPARASLFAPERGLAPGPTTAAATGRTHARAEASLLAPECDLATSPLNTVWQVSGFLGRVLDPHRYRFALFREPGPGRRPSRTRFRALASACGRSLVEVLPATGRTHQIRVHLAAVGMPVVGDPVYGPAEPAAASRADRLQLHAAALVLELGPGPAPATLEVCAPLPPDLEADFAELAGAAR